MEESCELTEYELGYIAGIIDGEGWLGINRMKVKCCRDYTYIVRCVIGGTDRKLMDFLQCLCEGGSVRPKKPAGENYKPSYDFTIGKHILEKLLPELDLVVKRKQKELILEAMSIVKAPGDRCSVSGRERLEEIYQELKKLNRRGIHS